MTRYELLVSWLLDIFKENNFTCEALAGDASFRRYWRIRIVGFNQSYVVMDAPPPETTKTFIDIAHVFAHQGLSVPSILDSNLEQGFLLLSDLGDDLYLQALHDASRVDVLYQDAMNALLNIHACDTTGLSYQIPFFDMVFMEGQLGIFKTWYLEKHLGLKNAVDVWEKTLQPLMKHILETIIAQPIVLIHRDYHSRNLMVIEHNTPGILDFQDAMMGPITYDLVSLFQDCYISWPIEQVMQWVLGFKHKLIEAKLLHPNVQDAQFIQWFEWTGLQRHLKNLGIFSRLHYRDGKSGYLSDIPRVLNYISQTCQRYTELIPIWRFFEEMIDTPKLISLEAE